MNNFRFEIAFGGDGEQRYGHRQIEAARPAGAGIQIEDAFALIEIGDVSVAGEDSGEAAGGGIEMEGLEVVKHVDVEAFGKGDLSLRQLGALPFPVDVATDGGDGRDFAEFLKDGEFAHVAAMEDEVHAGKHGDDFGTEEAVRVADD